MLRASVVNSESQKNAAYSAEPIFAVSLGALAGGLVDVVASSVTTTFPALGTRAMHALWDVSLLVSLGLLCDAAIHVARRITGGRWWLFWPLLLVLGSAGMGWTLQRIFSRQSDALLNGRVPALLYAAFIVASGAGIVVCVGLGRWLARRGRWFVVGVAVSLAAAVANVIVYRDDYIEIHTAVAWSAATLGGSASARALSRMLALRPARARRVIMALATLGVTLSLVPPPNQVRLSLFRSPGAVGAWVFANTTWPLPDLGGAPDPRVDPRWFAPRTEGTRPAGQDRLTAEAPVVVLLTIDAVRADALLGENETRFPTLSRLMREGVTFTGARSPGSQTAVSLTAVFAGKYFSEMRWEKYGEGTSRFEYAAKDETPRFVSLLSDSGVSTSKVVSLTFLRNEFGVAPGFQEETIVTQGRRHARAKEVIDPLLTRLRALRHDERLFAYAHMTEPHAPYDRGKLKQGDRYERYLSEIALADEHVSKLVNVLGSGGLAKRSLLIVTSDHGEAFGEHGTFEHTKTIYDELLRVPLIVWGRGVKSRSIEAPVTLVDIGPTVLDVFGVDTPDWMAGESLVPLLVGRDVDLGRPVLAEGRLRRAMVVGDVKVIVDLRRRTVEAFDIAKDPGELRNLYDEDPARVAPALAALGAYYQGRAFTKDGYQPIYKP